jgi:hypothetical protein
VPDVQEHEGGDATRRLYDADVQEELTVLAGTGRSRRLGGVALAPGDSVPRPSRRLLCWTVLAFQLKEEVSP